MFHDICCSGTFPLSSVREITISSTNRDRWTVTAPLCRKRNSTKFKLTTRMNTSISTKHNHTTHKYFYQKQWQSLYHSKTWYEKWDCSTSVAQTSVALMLSWYGVSKNNKEEAREMQCEENQITFSVRMLRVQVTLSAAHVKCRLTRAPTMSPTNYRRKLVANGHSMSQAHESPSTMLCSVTCRIRRNSNVRSKRRRW